MKRNTLTKMGLTVIALLLIGGMAFGDYIDGFETSDNAGYIAGQTIADVNGWVRTNGQTTDNLVEDDLVYAGTQALRIGRDSSGTAAWASVYKQFTAPDTSGGQHVIADVYLATQADVLAMQIYFGSSGTTSDAAAQFGFAGGDGTGTGTNSFRYRDGNSDVYVPDVTFTPNTYYHFVADLDISSATYDLTITGTGVDVTIEDIAFRNSGTSVIDHVIVMDASTSGFPNRLFWADNLSITSIPEPATMTLLAMGAAGMIIRRRRA